jgi:hypothetical protein
MSGRPVHPGCAGDLVCEAERYLALVDDFRAEGCEPRWRLERTVVLRAALAALPGPASSGARLVSTKTAAFALNPGAEGPFSVSCGTGEKALGGGFTTPNFVLSIDTVPTSDGSGWQLYLVNGSPSQSASGNVQAVCIR